MTADECEVATLALEEPLFKDIDSINTSLNLFFNKITEAIL